MTETHLKAYGETGRIPVVEHSRVWLERTQAWLHEQLSNLPSEFEIWVAADRAANEDEFPRQRVSVLRHKGRLPYLASRVAGRAGIARPTHLSRVLSHSDAQLLHSHFGPVGWDSRGAAKRAGVPHVVTFYGCDVTQLPRVKPIWKNRYERLFQTVDLVLCEGPHMAREIRKLGCDSGKVVVQRLGVPVSSIDFSPRVRPLDTLRVLIAGRFCEKKGISIALEALARMSTSFAFQVTVVGSADRTAVGKENERQIRQSAAKCKAPVRFLGSVDHQTLRRLYYEHDVLLSPSVTAADGDTEGGAPVTIIEAAATGMPVVSTWHCDIPDVLAKGTSLLSPERDIDALVASLEWLLHNEWEPLLSGIRKDLEDRYDSRKQGAALGELYRGLVASRLVPTAVVG